jgi:hypothetical protein
MNYTGFGSDPNYIYSFRGKQQPTGLEAVTAKDAMQPLRNWLGYKQAGIEGRERMEKAIKMGLPVNTDINKAVQVGYDPTRRQTIYAAPRPMPFGTFGAVGGGGEGKEPSPNSPMPTPPKDGMANIAGGVAPTLVPTPSSYSGSALTGTSYTPSAGNMGMGAYSRPKMESQQTSIAGGVAPASLAAPLPRLNFPTRQDEILNPYGLMNY